MSEPVIRGMGFGDWKCAYCHESIGEDMAFRRRAGLFYHEGCAHEAGSSNPSVLSSVKEEKGPVNRTYAGVEFELVKYSRDCTQYSFSFAESLTRLKRRGFERHALPSECFSLICEGLEGKIVEPNLQKIFADMNMIIPEWCGLVVEKESGAKGDVLVCYENPIDGLGNDAQEIRRFELNGLQEGAHSAGRAAEKSPELIEYLFSRIFDELPWEVKSHAKIFIPAPNQSYIFVRDGAGCFFYNCNEKLKVYSRGVRGLKRFNSLSDEEAAKIRAGQKKESWLSRLFGWS